MDHLRVEAVGHFVAECCDAKPPRMIGRINLGKDRVEIKIIEMFRTPANLPQKFGAADNFVERAIAKFGQNLAHFLGDEGHQVDDFFR